MADGKLCMVCKGAFAPYERPALTKASLFHKDKKPARLPEFQLLPRLARSQPMVDRVKLQNASTVEEALQIAQSSLDTPVAV